MIQEQQESSINGNQNPQMSDSYMGDLSIVTAFNQLRKTQDKIYLARHRLDVLQTMRSRAQKKSRQNERMKNKSVQISNFIKQQKEKKERYQDMRLTHRQQLYVKNVQRRKQHKQKIQIFKKTLQQNNQWIHEQARNQRAKRQMMIKKSKNKELQAKYRNRQQLFESEKKRIDNVHQYMRNKRIQSIERKEEQAELLKSRIEERSKILMHLERKGSKSDYQFPEKSQNSQVSHPSRDDKFEKTYGKKFIIKQANKNQTTILLK